MRSIGVLLELSHEIGRTELRLAILGEGNTSAKLSDTQFAVKASGSCLATLAEGDVTICENEKLISLLDRKTISDEAIHQTLLDSRFKGNGKKPSVEAMFHAWLLTIRRSRFRRTLSSGER